MSKEYQEKLISRAKVLQSKLDNNTRQIVDLESYYQQIISEANSLVGYILALEELENETK